MGLDRMAIMMISQCNKTKNLALNQQTLWESISLFQLNKITFLDFSLQTLDSYMLIIEQLSVPAGKISRIPWGISGDFGCWWRESTRKFGL